MDYRELSKNITHQQTHCPVIERKLFGLKVTVAYRSKEASLQKCKEAEVELSKYD